MPRFEKLEKYYLNKNAINTRLLDSSKPNNKISHAFASYISNMATGYFMGKGIRYIIEDEDFSESLKKVIDEEYDKDKLFEIAKEASKTGIAYELIYINEKSELKTKMFKASEIIPLYSNKVDEFLEGAIRLWTESDIFSDTKIQFAELYTKDFVKTFKKTDNTYILIDEREHFLGDVPLIIYQNNQELKGDYENVIPLIDAYDKAQSDTANDFEYFTDAFLLLIGAGGGFVSEEFDGELSTSQAVREMRKERVILLDEKGQAEWLIKNINDTAVENYKDRIRKDLFFLAQVPALSDESFGQNVSGISIKYKLIGLEELTVIKENKFRSATKKRIKIIVDYINKSENQSFLADAIEIFFDRNTIENIEELINNASKLEGITSKRTQLSQLPFIDNPDEEIKRIIKENLDEEGSYMIDEDEFFIKNANLKEF